MKFVAYHYSLNNIEIGTSVPPRMYESFMGKKALIEESLEKFRQDNCPQCHTRLNCVFLAPSEDSAKYLEICISTVRFTGKSRKSTPENIFSIEK